MRVFLPITFLILTTSYSVADETSGSSGSSGNSGNSGKDRKDKGMVPIPATHSYSGCRLKTGKIAGCKSKPNFMIQMGECWANTRILGQRAAFFVPVKPGTKNYDAEGGPYGTCTGWDCCPKVADMEKSDNLAEFCFIWETNPNGGGGKKKDKNGKSDNSTDTCNPKAPGESAIPMPIVCPSTLKNCYSADWYDPGGKLAKFGSLVPTYRGPWFPLKSPKDHKPLFCPGLNLGCSTPTMRQFQLHNLPKVGCDTSKCKTSSTGGGGGGGNNEDPENPEKNDPEKKDPEKKDPEKKNPEKNGDKNKKEKEKKKP